jgi:hypothetical protein
MNAGNDAVQSTEGVATGEQGGRGDGQEWPSPEGKSS